MSSQTPYIGSKISLISKLDIRYEGILYTVDTNDSTIALAKVRSFGTEKRRSEIVPPRDEIFEYIIFKASDIKDLIVCDTPKMASLSGGLPYDPAIISVSSRSAPAPSGDGAPTTESAGSSRSNTPNRQSPLANLVNKGPGAGRGGLRVNRGGYQPQGDRQGANRTYNNYNNYNRGNNRGRDNYGVPRVNQREKLKFENDFDFEKANEEFQEALTDTLAKLKIEGEPEEVKEQQPEPEEKQFYDKKTSFFDNISCEALEKAEGKNGRPDFRMNQINQETFGRYAVRSLNYRRGNNFGRGGYRGYNGYNNRGGNYNGYRNNYNNYNNRRGNNYQNKDNQQPREAKAQTVVVGENEQ